MSDLFDFLSPIQLTQKSEDLLGNFILPDQIHTDSNVPEIDQARIAIIGVEEDRMSNRNQGCSLGSIAVRDEVYALQSIDNPIRIIDLGNIRPGNSYEDTCFALKAVLEKLLKSDIIPIVIGGSQDLTLACYQAYEKLEQIINLVSIDHTIDIGDEDDALGDNYLRHIVLHEPNYMFNFCNIGHQRPYTRAIDIELLEKMYFDQMRLGELFNMAHESEPYIRNADILSIDISALKHSDAPGNQLSRPNGLGSDQICQMSKYAGMSDKLSMLGIFEFNPELDQSSQTAKLISEMIWYFTEGVSNRKSDYPIGDKEDYIKYTVPLEGDNHEIVFYKSPKSDRWWMDVPYTAGRKNKYQRHHLVPCSYSDYQKATNNDMPDLWWKTYQKLA